MKIKLCDKLIKIISNEFDLDDVAKHVSTCDECKKTLYLIIDKSKTENMILNLALNLIKTNKLIK